MRYFSQAGFLQPNLGVSESPRSLAMPAVFRSPEKARRSSSRQSKRTGEKWQCGHSCDLTSEADGL